MIVLAEHILWQEASFIRHNRPIFRTDVSSSQHRLARNVRAPTEGLVAIKLFGVPETFAAFLGLATI